jgi:hypothetical protein
MTIRQPIAPIRKTLPTAYQRVNLCEPRRISHARVAHCRRTRNQETCPPSHANALGGSIRITDISLLQRRSAIRRSASTQPKTKTHRTKRDASKTSGYPD